ARDGAHVAFGQRALISPRREIAVGAARAAEGDVYVDSGPIHVRRFSNYSTRASRLPVCGGRQKRRAPCTLSHRAVYDFKLSVIVPIRRGRSRTSARALKAAQKCEWFRRA